MTADIHHGQPVINFGAEINNANMIVILLHGRGSNAEAMLPIAEALSVEGARFTIPQAALNRWYLKLPLDHSRQMNPIYHRLWQTLIHY